MWPRRILILSKMQWQKGLQPFPIIKTTESDFKFNGETCDVVQNLGLEMANQTANAELKVYYDAKALRQRFTFDSKYGCSKLRHSVRVSSSKHNWLMTLEMLN